MKLHVEISVKSGYWNEDTLRRRVKREVLNAIDDAVNETDGSELMSLRFVVPKAKRRKAAS